MEIYSCEIRFQVRTHEGLRRLKQLLKILTRAVQQVIQERPRQFVLQQVIRC